MTFERLDDRAIKRISGPAWDRMRPRFEAAHLSLIAVSDTAHGKLMTIYVKYLSEETGSRPFAVMWLRKSTELLIGLALPEKQIPKSAVDTQGIAYEGLTAYFRIEADNALPERFADMTRAAYGHLLTKVSGVDPS
jgi:hypothetical protein